MVWPVYFYLIIKLLFFLFPLKVDLGEGKICFCCEEYQPAKCTDKENALKLFPVQPCSAVHLLLKVSGMDLTPAQ